MPHSIGIARLAQAASLALLMSLAGCDGQQGAKTADGSAPASPAEYTSWWKSGEAAATGATAQAPALAGWAKLGAIQPALAKQGQEQFASKCAACHSIGHGQVVGPDLKGLTGRVEPEWATAFMKDPAPLLETDAHAKDMLAKYLVKMPNLQLTPDQLAALTEYLRQQDQLAAKP